MANAGENQPYHDVEPIFNGSSIRLPFFMDNVCPGIFVSFLGDCGYNRPQELVGHIIAGPPMGQVKMNLFYAPDHQDHLSIVHHSSLVAQPS